MKHKFAYRVTLFFPEVCNLYELSIFFLRPIGPFIQNAQQCAFFSDHFLSIGKFTKNKELHVAFVGNEITSLSTIFDHRVFPMKQLHWPMSILGSLSANSILHLQSLTNFFGPPAFVSVKYTFFGLQMPPPPPPPQMVGINWPTFGPARCFHFISPKQHQMEVGRGLPKYHDKRCVKR